MRTSLVTRRGWLLLFLLLLFAGCRQEEDQEPAATARPTIAATPTADLQQPTAEFEGDKRFITVATDAPSRFQDFADIDPFGNVIGFDADVMADLAVAGDFDYEFVVTSFSGLLDTIVNDEFDIAMSALVIPEEPQDGLTYTIPYLEVGQVLVVRANDTALQSYTDIRPGVPIAAQRFSSSEQTAREVVGITEPELQLYDRAPDALQALIDGEVEGAIIDSDDALHFTSSYPQQLKIAGGVGNEAWISRKAYGIALPTGDEALLEMLNDAIRQAQAEGTIERLTVAWLIPQETIDAGESLVGTPANEIVIGLTGQLTEMDPAARDPDLLSWEVKRNTMSGLVMYDRENNLIPILAADFPAVSEDKLTYTFVLRPGLTFPDGGELTADDVKFSINRSARLGNFLVNGYLKDEDEDGFADEDAVEVLDALTVQLILKTPTSYFTSLLATPPYFVISEDCLSANFEPGILCAGLGPYTITEWEQNEQMRLKANPQWPGTPPAFENIQLRFYDDPARMRRSLENNAIDIAWTGLQFEDMLELRQTGDFSYWEGPSAFKSYLVFEQNTEPWDNALVRQAIALSVDRQALASEVFDEGRQPLFSPVPTGVVGHTDTEPIRDLSQAQSLLTAVGYSTENKLEITIWYVNDGRYTDREEAYAQLLESQLEEAGLVDVTLQGATWDIFRPQSLACNYPAYLLGWPSSGQPAAYIDAMSWMEYFVTNTDNICSNYENPAMDALLTAALEELDLAARLELYQQIQLLWAQDFPTLDLTQEPRVAISLPNIQNVVIDAMGLMRYDVLLKGGGSGEE